jgi:hypothetical protein
VPNLMQMNSNKELSSLTLGSAHEKLHVWHPFYTIVQVPIFGIYSGYKL